MHTAATRRINLAMVLLFAVVITKNVEDGYGYAFYTKSFVVKLIHDSFLLIFYHSSE